MSVERFARKELLELGPVSLARRRRLTESIPGLINLGAGDPDFNQPESINKAVYEAMKEGHTHYVFYDDPDFKVAIAEYYQKYGVEIDPATQVFITSGGSIGIFHAFAAIINPGDELLVLDPSYGGYIRPLKYFGGKIKRAKMTKDEKGNFRPNIENIKANITEKTKAFIFCNPDNPTGTVYTNRELTSIAELAVENDLIVISDEIYTEFIWNKRKHLPIINKPGMWERTLVIMSFSKTFAWTGCRAGNIIAGPNLTELLISVPMGNLAMAVPFQKAGIYALKNSWDFVENMRQTYKERIEYSVKRLNEIDGIKCIHPEGAYYLFPDISELGITSAEFAEGLFNEEKVRIFPGSNFGPNAEGHVRISLIHPIDTLKEAYNRIERYTKNL
jgi:aminotransferase